MASRRVRFPPPPLLEPRVELEPGRTLSKVFVEQLLRRCELCAATGCEPCLRQATYWREALARSTASPVES